MLGLCDFVYASSSAWFLAPFSAMGLCPEGCSSYTFPAIVGPVRANEVMHACGSRSCDAHGSC